MGDPALVPATFLERENRFVVRAALPGAGSVHAHLGDPGRLRELLLPGASLRLRPAAGPRRRTRFTVSLVRDPRPPHAWVSLETTRANELAQRLLRRGRIAGGPEWEIRREVTHGSSRFDFMLQRGDRRMWVEVKSVTLVERGVGLFPDAPTERGRRHVRELTAAVEAGDRALVLFVVQRADARLVMPHDGIDPKLAEALSAARRAGVSLRAVSFRPSPGGSFRYLGPLPVRLPRGQKSSRTPTKAERPGVPKP